MKRMKWSDGAWKCHVLFISVSDKRHVAQSLAQLRDMPVLTVSEIGGFTQAGGMIEFVFDEDRVRFDINRDAALRAKLRIDARLLAVAHAVNSKN